MGISRTKLRKFVSLHSHSTYSYGDGYATPIEHAERIRELGGDTLALTEHGNAGSWVQLEKAATKTGIKPIFGMEAYAAPPETRQKFHQTILAETPTGLANLNELVSRSYSEGFYQWPTVHGPMMREHADGLIMTSGCADSLLSCTLLGGKSLGDRRDRASKWDMDKAEEIVRRYQSMLGVDGFFLEVQRFPGLDRTKVLNPAFAELSRRTGAPLVATADVHYPYGSQNEMQKILHAAHRGGTVDSVEAAWEYNILLTYPTSDWEIYQDMIETGLEPSDAWQAICNSREIADRCNVTLPKNEMLRFPIPDGTTAQEELWDWLRQGWKFRWKENKRLRRNPDAYAKKVNYEMELVTAKGYEDYFLTTSYLVRRAKNKGIPVGPARGSAAASLVLYLLRVTEVDPMQFPTMVFERFIDHGRTDLPDIDLDFSDARRDEVREDAADVFGSDRVANIGNVVGYKGRNSLNDVAKVYRIPKGPTETVKDVILERSGGDSRADNTLEDSIAMFPQAQAVLDQYPALKRAMDLEGNVRSMGVHAAGLVISNRPIDDTCARITRKDKNGNPRSVLQYDKKDAEYLGMLKMDFLGLNTMGMIQLALDMIPEMDLVDLYRVPLTNKRVLRAFRDNDLTGIFQFEGRATKLVNAGVKPDHFMHLADINALSRPGPLFSGMTAEYMRVKNGENEPDHIHPMVWKYTQHTYGQIIYQEQVLEIIRTIGGFPVAKIGDIRRIISQKLGEASMQTMFEEFVAGAAKHDIDRALATRIWKFMVTSATYSFNIAHCISYSMLAFWCMYLKVYYPREFYAAQLQKIGDDKKSREYRRPRLLTDAIRKGMVILPPHPKHSDVTWTRGKRRNTIQAGFLQVEGIGAVTAQNIVQYREQFGLETWDDLLAVKGIGQKTIETIREFVEKDDPFDVELTARTLGEIRTGIKRRQPGYRGLPVPTHRSDEIPRNVDAKSGIPVTWMGVVRNIEYKDVIEDERARTGDDLDTILARLKDPELTKSVTLHCYDDGDDDVYVRFNRWAFPRYRDTIEGIAPGEDVIIVSGEKSPGFGVSLNRVKNLIVLAAEDDGEEEEVA